MSIKLSRRRLLVPALSCLSLTACASSSVPTPRIGTIVQPAASADVCSIPLVSYSGASDTPETAASAIVTNKAIQAACAAQTPAGGGVGVIKP